MGTKRTDCNRKEELMHVSVCVNLGNSWLSRSQLQKPFHEYEILYVQETANTGKSMGRVG